MPEKKEKLSDDFWAGVLTVFVAPVLVVAIVVPATIIGGFILQKLWEWWVADTFGIKELTLVEAMGLSTLRSYYTFKGETTKRKKVNWKKFFSNIISILLILLMAWVLTFFK